MQKINKDKQSIDRYRLEQTQNLDFEYQNIKEKLILPMEMRIGHGERQNQK